MTMDYDTKNADRLNPGRLIVDRQSPALKQLLWHLVRSAKGNDVLAPVTVVGPTRYANLSLRQEFGRGGFVNVRFIVMPVLSELLGAAALAGEGRRPLTAVLESMSLRQAMAQTTGPLAPVREHPTTQASVRASFRALRRTNEGVLTALERQGGVRGEIVRLYRHFRRHTVSDWYDVEDLAETAAESVRRGTAPGLADLGLIVFYLPRNTTPAETRLIEALARQDRCAVLLGTTGDSEADAPTQVLAGALRPLLGEPQMVGDGGPSLPLLAGEARLHIAPNASLIRVELRLGSSFPGLLLVLPVSQGAGLTACTGHKRSADTRGREQPDIQCHRRGNGKRGPFQHLPGWDCARPGRSNQGGSVSLG